MSKLALVVVLFVILIKAAFGADLPQFNKEESLDGKVTAALTSAKATADAKSSQQKPWTISAKQYVAEFRKEVSILANHAENKFSITQEYVDSLEFGSEEMEEYSAATAALVMICGLEGASDKDLMFLLIKFKSAEQESSDNQQDMSAILLKMMKEKDSFNAEKEFAKADSKAKYLDIITKLKAFNAATARAPKGGPKEYVAFADKAAQISF